MKLLTFRGGWDAPDAGDLGADSWRFMKLKVWWSFLPSLVQIRVAREERTPAPSPVRWIAGGPVPVRAGKEGGYAGFVVCVLVRRAMGR